MDDVWGAEKHNPLGFKRTAPELEDDGCLISWTSFFLPGLVSKVSNKKQKIHTNRQNNSTALKKILRLD